MTTYDQEYELLETISNKVKYINYRDDFSALTDEELIIAQDLEHDCDRIDGCSYCLYLAEEQERRGMKPFISLYEE